MSRSSIRLGATICSLAFCFQPAAAADSSVRRPNIVVVIADDLGFGETGMMGRADIPTPHIDALAQSGVRCTSGYVTSSYCSPSRAGIMTGRYQSRFGYDHNPTGPRNLLESAGPPVSEATFTERLSTKGYATGLIGKWHLGTTEGKQPTSRGFDYFYGFLHEGHFYVPGPPFDGVWTMIRDRNLPSGDRVRQGNLFRGNYARISEPDYDGDNPVLKSQQPIDDFAYLTDAITEEACEFIDRTREEPFCLVVSYSAVHSPMQATIDDLARLDHITDIQRRIFAGMLTALDRGVGRISGALGRYGLIEDTLVVFVSDNGGPTAELTSSNLPLRGEKGSLYEGGIRVPMVWSMPGTLPSGISEDRPVLSLDIAATALELGGFARPADFDGHSVLDWIGKDSSRSPHHTIYWRMQRGKRALRQGDWKIVRPGKGAPEELYDLSSDLAEANDLSKEKPELLADMTARWEELNSKMEPAK